MYLQYLLFEIKYISVGKLKESVAGEVLNKN